MREFIRNHPWLIRVTLALVCSLLIIISLTAFWLYRTMYNNDRFTEIATTAITEQSSRDSVGRVIVDKAFADRPVAQKVVGPRLASLISGLLGTDIAESVIEKVVERTHILLTTPRREPIVLEIAGIKQTISSLQNSISEDRETLIDPEKLPDEIMVVDTTKIPNVYQYGVILLWLAPLSLVVALCVLGAWVYKAKVSTARLLRFRMVLGVILATTIAALLIGPLFKPLFLSVAQTAQAQTLLGNLYEGFMTPFNTQAKNLGLLTAFVLVVTYFWTPLLARLQTIGSSSPAKIQSASKTKTGTKKRKK